MNSSHGMSVIFSVYATCAGEPVTVTRTWKERWLTRPWRPWVTTRTFTPQIPTSYVTGSRLVIHPALLRGLRAPDVKEP